ncbi:MAG: class I SAM-dependent methyltransferase [bacterium]
MIDFNSIPKSESDLLLSKWGYDLMDEYYQLIAAAEFKRGSLILDLATGTGRALSILSRMEHLVFTGDYNYDFKAEVERRVTGEYANQVTYIILNLEKIPFPDNSFENIVCIDTLHELENPFLCLGEIIRIHAPAGKLLIADFNNFGFDVMDKLHFVRYGRVHPKGKILLQELKNIIVGNYYNAVEIDTKLNKGFIARDKRNGKSMEISQ